MKASLAREWSLWHQLQLGHKFYVSNATDKGNEFGDNETKEKEYNNEKLKIEKSIPHYYDYNDDERLSIDKHFDLEKGDCYTFLGDDETKTKTKKPFLNIYAKTIIMVIATFYYVSVYISDRCKMQHMNNGIDTDSMVDCHHHKHFLNDLTDSTPTEVFQVYTPPYDYGNPVYSQVVLNYTFGNSWGKPAIVEYSAPSKFFTHVELELDTTVDGVQYDRLGHIYLNNIPIWRTSTIEPAGHLSHSKFTKDVTLYNKLFRKDGELMFQLDNLLTTRLTGAFNVTLTAHYYDHEPVYSEDNDGNDDDDDDSDIKIDNFFNTGLSGEASTILPIVNPSNPGRPPLIYYPDGKIHYTIPKLSSNTTSVKLELFSTGNADEEFWYGNLLDTYKDIFKDHGQSFPGHGPCRVIHVYLDGIRVSSVNPYPIIYTGGLSPALWRPIVGAGTFDIKALEIDLTSLLPIFWTKNSHLEVKITNCLDDDDDILDGDKSGIGNNWITTGNILTWENSNIYSSFGEIIEFDNSTSVKSFGFQPPPIGKKLTQFVSAQYKNSVNSILNYTLIDGTELNFETEITSNANQSSIGSISSYGKKQSLMTFPISDHSFRYKLINSEGEKTSDEKLFLMEHKYGLIVDTTTERLGTDVTYKVKLKKSTNVKIHLDDIKVLNYKGIENGNSTYFVSPNGNHGFASTEHDISMNRKSPLPTTSYNRIVKAINGTLVYDSDEKMSSFFPTLDLQNFILENENVITPEINQFVDDLMNAINKGDNNDESNQDSIDALLYLNDILSHSDLEEEEESENDTQQIPILSSFY